jgi:hypothetical protein
MSQVSKVFLITVFGETIAKAILSLAWEQLAVKLKFHIAEE